MAVSDATKEAFLAEPEERTEGPDPDADLLEGCRRGDLAAFEQLFRAHGPRMKSLAFNLLGNVSDAEDAVQESFLKVYRAAATFQRGARVSTWIYRILVNSCYDMLRRRRRRPENEPLDARADAPFDLPAVAQDHPLRLDLEDSLAKIPSRPRTVFLLAAVEGFTHREIGDILRISEAASRTLLFEARRRLQALLVPVSSPARRAEA